MCYHIINGDIQILKLWKGVKNVTRAAYFALKERPAGMASK
jgi:hypothetical protein